MTALTDSQLAAVGRVFVTANTPTYLYNRLRETPVVSQLSRQSIDALRDMINQASAKRHPSDLELARGYAALIALLAKEEPEVLDAIDRLSLRRLRWGRQLIDLARRSRTPTQLLEATGSSVVLSPMARAKSTATTQTEQYTGEGDATS